MKRILNPLAALMALTLSAGAMASKPETPELAPVQEAKNNGFTECLGAVRMMAEFLIGDASGEYGSHGLWSHTQTSGKMYTAQIERNFTDGVMLMNMTVVHNQVGSCSAQYTKTFMTDKPCDEYSATIEGGIYKGEVSKQTLLLELDSTTVYLQPVGQTCLVIRKEIVDLPVGE